MFLVRAGRRSGRCCGRLPLLPPDLIIQKESLSEASCMFCLVATCASVFVRFDIGAKFSLPITLSEWAIATAPAAVCGVASWQKITHCPEGQDSGEVLLVLDVCKICQTKVASTSVLHAASFTLQWWRVTELWYLSPPGTHSFSLAPHSSSAWHSSVNYWDVHQS